MVRKIVAFVLALVTVAALSIPLAAGAAGAGEYDWMKVRLSTQGVTSLALPVSGSYFIQENGNSFSGGTLYIVQAGGQVQVSHSAAGALYTGASCRIMRENVKPSAGYIQIPTVHGNRRYLGHFNVKPTGSGLQVVNEVPLAHYLYGVVGHEMSDAFPLEALKAQAVVSKCYILSSIRTSGDYYMGDTSSDQVYKGYDSSATNVIKAVDSTLGVVLTVGGKILRTYYAASNGGETNLVSYAWSSSSSNAGYGISIDDYDFKNPSSLLETVTFTYGRAPANARVNAYLLMAAGKAANRPVSTILSVDSVQAHSPRYSQTARNLTKATISLTVDAPAGGSPAAPVDPTPTSPGSGLGFGGLGFGLGFGLPSDGSSGGSSGGGTGGIVPVANISNVSYKDNKNGTATVKFDFLLSDLLSNGVVTSNSLRIYWGEKTSGGYTIYHARYGHGVGMSQRGAQQRAKAGQSYTSILSFYYPGAKRTTIQVNAPQDPAKPINQTAIAYGITTGSDVSLRKGAGTNYSRVTRLKKNADLTVFGKTNGWYYVQSGKYVGYIIEDYVKITQEVTPTQPIQPTQPTAPVDPGAPKLGF